MDFSSITWNWDFFSTIGYIGVGVAIVALGLWLIHFLFRAKPFICHLALLLAIAAFVLAKINSVTHVNLIQLDPAAQKAAFEAQQQAKRQALLDSRGGEVAQIKFAEDGSNDFLDRAGMDESDLKYFDKQTEGEQEWKQEKQARSGSEGDSDAGMTSEELEQAEQAEPILMAEAEMTFANQLDTWALRITRWLIYLGIGIVILDNLQRANRYKDAYWPMPITSNIAKTLNPYPSVVVRPDRPRRSMPKEVRLAA